MTTGISDVKLKNIVKESVKEVLETELMKLKALFLTSVSKKEQENIEKQYGTPAKV